MQPHRPAIAVVTPSILTGLGLESILRRIIPMAEVEVYDRFERFAADRPDRFSTTSSPRRPSSNTTPSSSNGGTRASC